MTTTYEWDVETVVAVATATSEAGEIIDHNHFDTFAEAAAHAATDPGTGLRHAIVLTRDDEFEMGWAYIDSNGMLPVYFTDALGTEGARVPLRFAGEVARAIFARIGVTL